MTNELPNDRPLLQAAALCDRILQEKDNTISAIRMVDRFQIPAGTSREIGIPLNVLFSFKTGEYQGEFEVTFRVRRPSGAHKLLPERFPAKFLPGSGGVNFMIAMALQADERGVHYIDALRGDDVLASIVFTLVDGPAEEPAANASTTDHSQDPRA